MSIFDKLQERATGMRTPRREPFSVTMQECAISHRPVIDANTEYELQATVRITYWANDAQRTHARRIAEKSLAAFLYGDFLALVSQCEHAISDGDDAAAISACSAMRDKILGNRP